MASEIKCPNCGHEFDPGDSFKKEVQEQLRSQMEDWKKKKEKEFTDKETEFKKQLQEELQESLRKSIAGDYENQLKMLKESAAASEEKLKDSRKKELEFLQKEQSLKIKEEELQITLQNHFKIRKQS